MKNPFIIRKIKSLIPYFLLALAIIAAFQIMNHLGAFSAGIQQVWNIVTPFFYGALLAYIIHIPADAIGRLLAKSKVEFIAKKKKMLSILIVVILLLLILVLILNLVIPAIIQSITLFLSNFPAHYENALGFIDRINEFDLLGLRIDMNEIMAGLQEEVQNFSLDNLMSPLNAVIGVGGAIFGGLFRGFLTLVSAIYFLVERDKIKAFFCRMIRAFTSTGVYKGILKYTGSLNQNFKRYLYTQTIDGLILGTAATAFLWVPIPFLIGSPYALVLGIMLGILNYIPYFGSIVGTMIAVLVILFTQGFTTGLVALIGLLVIQQIDANIIQPKLMGSSFSISPLLIIISITIGGALAGVLGMIVAIPIVSVLKDMLESVIAYYEQKRPMASEDASSDE